MKDVEVITLEDRDYYVLNEVKYKDISYLYLSCKDDMKKTMIRKDVDGVVVPLDDKKELELACGLLFKEAQKRY